MYFNGTKCRLFILSCLASTSLFAKDIKTLNATGMQKPLCFVENKGQVMDEQQHSRKDIQYKLSTPGVSMYVGNGQLHYQFKKADLSGVDPIVTNYNMDVTLLGANKNAQVTASEQLEYTENYYLAQLGNDGITAHTYAKLTYKDVYPNIDWVIYVKSDKVEYDFVVRPGGNTSDIQLQYGGATDLSLTKDGGILAKTPMGDVAEHQPVTFETTTGKKVASRFALHNNVVSFVTDKYQGSLTIDPYLQWSTYLGGTLEDVITGVKMSTAASVFVSGYTLSTAGISSGAGVYQSTFGAGTAGNYDAFLARYSNTGVLQWCTYYGGTGTDKGMAVATDAGGNPYMVGSTTTAANLATAGADHFSNSGGSDIFIAKFSRTNGSRTWATFEGGTTDDFGYCIGFDAAGAVYIGGTTSSAGVASAGAYQTTLSGTTDGYLAKFNALTGAKTWATYFGGSGQDEIDGLASDASNRISITGQTNSLLGIATAGAYQAALSGTNDAFVAQFSSAGALSWGTYFGGTGTEQGNGIATDASGNIYVTGNTTSTTAIATGLSYQGTYGGGTQDAFLTQLSSAGVVNWGTYFGGASDDYGKAVCTDAFGNIVITGYTFSTTGIATSQGYQTTLGGDDDAYIAKFNVYGQNLYGSYFGNAFFDYSNAVAVDPTNTNIIIAGYTNSTTGIASAGAQQTTFGGGTSDGFVSMFLKDTLVKINQPYVDTLVCPGGVLTVAYTTNFNFQVTNTFTVQLSDATGSFAAPVNIGTVTANASGTVSCTIPAATPAGTGYRIRIHASNPAFTSPDNIVNIQVVTSLPATTMTGTTPVCVGFPISVGVSAPYAVTSYTWTGPGAFSSTLQNPGVTASATTANAGIYSVSTTHNGCPAVVSTINIVVSTVIPPAPIDSVSPAICAGSNLYLFANSGMAGTFTYSWSGPGGYTSTDQNPVISPAAVSNAGTYSVVDTLAGCPSPASTIVASVNPIDTPNITITVNPSDTICVGDLASFTTTITNAGVTPGYQWMNGTTPIVGAIFSTYSSAFLSSTSQIYCILTNDIMCPDKPTDTSNVVHMVVEDFTPIVHIVAAPDTFVTSGSTVTFTGYVGGTAIIGYQWYLNGVAVPGATNTTYTLTGITTADTVQLQVSSNAKCANTGISNTIVVHIGWAAGVANVSSAFGDIAMYPNPNSGNFSVKGLLEGINEGNVNVSVTNSIGQVVYNGVTAIQNGKIDQTIDMKQVPAGMYILHLEKDGEGKIIRFMVD